MKKASIIIGPVTLLGLIISILAFNDVFPPAFKDALEMGGTSLLFIGTGCIGLALGFADVVVEKGLHPVIGTMFYIMGMMIAGLFIGVVISVNFYHLPTNWGIREEYRQYADAVSTLTRCIAAVIILLAIVTRKVLKKKNMLLSLS